MMNKPTDARALTSRQVARRLNVDRLTLLAWLRREPSLEPELRAIDDKGVCRYRFFTEADVARLAEYQKSLHTEKYMKGKAANVQASGQADEGALR
jgi:hypothetical protein